MRQAEGELGTEKVQFTVSQLLIYREYIVAASLYFTASQF